MKSFTAASLLFAFAVLSGSNTAEARLGDSRGLSSSSSDGSSFCRTINNGSLPVNGSSCAGQLPSGSNTGMCGSTMTDPTGATETTECSCDYNAGSKWACKVTGRTTAPPTSAPVPGDGNFCLTVNNGDLPVDGSSCDGQLPGNSVGYQCSGSRPATSPTGAMESVKCSCDYRTGSKWTCEVTSTTTPPPTFAPVPGTGKMNCPTSFAAAGGTGASCAGALPTGYSSGSCSWYGMTKTQHAKCTCAASDMKWQCEGSMTP